MIATCFCHHWSVARWAGVRGDEYASLGEWTESVG